MAKRRGKSRSIVVRRSRRMGRRAATKGVLPVLGAIGVAGFLLAQNFTSGANTPIGWLMAGNWNNALSALSGNLTSPTFIAGVIPAILVLALLLWLHKKYGAKTRLSGRWAVL